MNRMNIMNRMVIIVIMNRMNIMNRMVIIVIMKTAMPRMVPPSHRMSTPAR